MKRRLWSYLTRINRYVQQGLGSVRQHLDEPWERNFLIALIISAGITIPLIITREGDLLVIVGGLAAFITGAIGMNAPRETWMRDIAPELIAISIGMIGIDQLYQIRLTEEDRQSVTRQLGSPSYDFALEAVRIARYEGWIIDGSMKGADLRNANLQGVDLEDADLRGTDLRNANLQDAILGRADLQGTILGGADLRDADLRYVNLRNADLRYANFQGTFLGRADLQGALYNSKTLWTDAYHLPDEAINFDNLSKEEQDKLLSERAKE